MMPARQLGVSGPDRLSLFQAADRGRPHQSGVGRELTRFGPAIIQMDRQIQVSDPMLRAARGVMHTLIPRAGDGSALLLCRLFH